MKVRIVAVGGIKGAAGELAGMYERRCRHYWKCDIVEVGAGRGARGPEQEAERILGHVRSGDLVVALTREGTATSSVELASLLDECAVRAVPAIVFVIGGAFGLAPSVLARADRAVSLGLITLPHELARVVLLEQLYRAGTISRGEPYHKGPNPS